MALEVSEIKEEVSLDVGKSKGKNKKDEGEAAEAGCWVSTFKFFGSFLPSKSKVDSSMSGPTAHSGNPIFPLSLLVYIYAQNISFLMTISGLERIIFFFFY